MPPTSDTHSGKASIKQSGRKAKCHSEQKGFSRIWIPKEGGAASTDPPHVKKEGGGAPHLPRRGLR